MKEWGPRQKVELDSILSNHARLIASLIDAGVAGFRFDACKHIPPTYFDALFNATGISNGHGNGDMLIYGEALDGDPAVLSEYTHLMSMFDLLSFSPLA